MHLIEFSMKAPHSVWWASFATSTSALTFLDFCSLPYTPSHHHYCLTILHDTLHYYELFLSQQSGSLLLNTLFSSPFLFHLILSFHVHSCLRLLRMPLLSLPDARLLLKSLFWNAPFSHSLWFTFVFTSWFWIIAQVLVLKFSISSFTFTAQRFKYSVLDNMLW
jgi:hypothetical protein